MNIRKQIETRIDIHNTISFCNDKNALMYTLAERFERKCYRSCYILKVVSIIRQSELMCEDVGGYIDVMFEVSAIVLQPGQIITDCTIVNKVSTMGIDCINASSKYANIALQGGKYLDSVRVGQTIPLRVIKSGYDIYSDKIKVYATPKLHDDEPLYFKVQDDDVDVTQLTHVLDLIKAMPVIDQNGKSWKFFSDLFYAYKVQPPSASDIIKANVSVMSIADNIKKYTHIGYDNRVNPTLGIVSTTIPEGVVASELCNNTAICLSLLESYYNALRVVHEMITQHATIKSLNDHKNIWLVMGYIKR